MSGSCALVLSLPNLPRQVPEHKKDRDKLNHIETESPDLFHMTVQGREPHTGMELTDGQEPHNITQTRAPVRSHTRLSSCSFSKKGTFPCYSKEPAPLVGREERLRTYLMLRFDSLAWHPWEVQLKMWLNHSRLGECPGIKASLFIMLYPPSTTLLLQKSGKEAFTPQRKLLERRFI